jgi:hypothetical protein
LYNAVLARGEVLRPENSAPPAAAVENVWKRRANPVEIQTRKKNLDHKVAASLLPRDGEAVFALPFA